MNMTDIQILIVAIAASLGIGVILGRAAEHYRMRRRAIETAWRVYYRAANFISSPAMRAAIHQLELELLGKIDENAAEKGWADFAAEREKQLIAGLDDAGRPPPGWYEWHDETVHASLQEEAARGGRAFVTKDGMLGCTRHEFGFMPTTVAVWLLRQWARRGKGARTDG